jgi:hypothetical protein
LKNHGFSSFSSNVGKQGVISNTPNWLQNYQKTIKKKGNLRIEKTKTVRRTTTFCNYPD